jgi:chemotaxis signal transduction protein
MVLVTAVSVLFIVPTSLVSTVLPRNLFFAKPPCSANIETVVADEQTHGTASQVERKWFVSAELAGQWFAISAGNVHEVLGARPWLGLSGQRFNGVMAWHGGAIAVVDLSRITSIGTPLAAGVVRRRTAVVRSNLLTFALPVDAVREVSDVAPGDIVTLDSPRGDVCRQIATIGEIEALVLDLDTVVRWLLAARQVAQDVAKREAET